MTPAVNLESRIYDPSHRAGPCVCNPSHKAGAPGVNLSDIKWGSKSKDLCGQVSSQLCSKTATRIRAVTWHPTLSSGVEQACQGLGPGHRAGRACRPLALGSWSCPGPAGSVKVDRADRLAFGPQLWGVMGDGGSVLAFCLRPASGLGWSAEVLPAATYLRRGPAQPRAPAPAPHAGAAPSPWFLVLVFGSCLVRPFPSLGLPSP